MTTIHTPASLDEADQRLKDIERVLTARGWERAAILATVVRLPGSGGDHRSSRRRSNRESPVCSAEEYASRKLPGLRDANTIRTYVQRWLEINNGEYPQPDTDITLPTKQWEPVSQADAGSRISTDPVKAVQQVVEKHGLEAVADVVVETPKIDQAVQRAQLNKLTTEVQRRRLVDDTRRRDDDWHAWGDEHKTRVEQGGLPHQAVLDTKGARMNLRSAVKNFERNPKLTKDQRNELDVALTECEYLIQMLKGQVDHWTEDDRDYLASIGIEG